MIEGQLFWKHSPEHGHSVVCCRYRGEYLFMGTTMADARVALAELIEQFRKSDPEKTNETST